MATLEQRKAAIQKAARMVREDQTGFLRRAGDPVPPRETVPGQEDIGRPAVRELFRNTVTMADEDPPGMEFRVLRQLEWQNEPDVIYVTESKPLAVMELKNCRKYHERSYENARVWMEHRVVAKWTEVEH